MFFSPHFSPVSNLTIGYLQVQPNRTNIAPQSPSIISEQTFLPAVGWCSAISFERAGCHRNGGIRSAIIAFQFTCVVEFPATRKKRENCRKIVLEGVTRREQSLVLFHLLGKV